jgi:hypothetical protein
VNEDRTKLTDLASIQTCFKQSIIEAIQRAAEVLPRPNTEPKYHSTCRHTFEVR